MAQRNEYWDTSQVIFVLVPGSPMASLIALNLLIKHLPAMQETLVQFLGQGRSAGEGVGYPLQYSWAGLENSIDFGIDHLVMSKCRVISCVVGRQCLL